MKNCGNCQMAKKNGLSMMFCTFYGIYISATYDRCKRQKARIVEIEREIIKSRGPGDIREPDRIAE